jgi:hypothetical protein
MQGIVIYTSAEGEVVEKYEGLWNTGQPSPALVGNLRVSLTVYVSGCGHQGKCTDGAR